LDDDNDLAMAFAGDVWLFHAPARLTPDALKYFGVMPLSETVQVHITPGEPNLPLSDGLLARLNQSLPFVWAWRSSQSRQAAERLSARLKGLKVHVVPTLKANLELDVLRHEVERRWHVMDDTIVLHKDHANEAELAQALAKALDVRSEADFYENLLRCNNDHQRKEKLLSKGIADAEVDRCLREYSGCPGEDEQDQKDLSRQPTKGSAEDRTSAPAPASANESQQQKPVLDEQRGETSGKPTEQTGVSESSFRLKDIGMVEYVIGRPPQGGSESGRGGGSEGGSRERYPLTDKDKAELEEAGRCLAIRALVKLGYAVEPMAQNNPGFDLRAKKNSEELRVEVKAHSGRATVVEDFTLRQYKEYLGQQGYRWELWNVEHLAADDAEPVTITRYNSIPNDALDVSIFRLDLKKCQSSIAR